MFFVISKEKLYSYVISIFTVVVLFMSASIFVSKTNILPTSAQLNKKLPIYNVETSEKKIAFTMNCAWNADDINIILKVLDKTNTKITFFVVGDWVDKYPEAVKKIIDKGHEIRKPFKYASTC